MNMPLRLIGAGLAAASLTAVIAAQATPMLDVKMGLWESTATTNMGNVMAGVDTSKMPPEQKAQMEAMMKSMAGKPIVTKTCMTKEKFEKNSFMQNRPNSDCKQTITNNTRTSMDATVVCTTPQPMTAQMHLESVGSTAYTGTVKSKSTARGREMEVTIEMSGKWLGADCGDV